MSLACPCYSFMLLRLPLSIDMSHHLFRRTCSFGFLLPVVWPTQIVTLLSILIFGYDQSIAAIYIILLALLNDITMIMVAYDNVKPSRYPEKPTVAGLLTLSVFLGLLMMFFSLIFYVCGFYFLNSDFDSTDNYRQTVIYLQVCRLAVVFMFATLMFCFAFFLELCLPSDCFVGSALGTLFLLLHCIKMTHRFPSRLRCSYSIAASRRSGFGPPTRAWASPSRWSLRMCS